jgi:DNA-directed RNA polymerase subunit RPC12/RpoP
MKCFICGTGELEQGYGDDIYCPNCGTTWRRVS